MNYGHNFIDSQVWEKYVNVHKTSPLPLDLKSLAKAQEKDYDFSRMSW